MTFKNSMKILSSNFSLCWKQLAWMVLCTIITFSLAGLVAMPVFSMLEREGFFAAVADLFELIYVSPKEFPTAFADAGEMFIRLVKQYATSGLLASYIGTVLVFVLCGSLCHCVGSFTCGSVLDAKMSSNAHMSYCTRLLSCLGRSVSYTFAYIVISIPFWAALVVLVRAYFAFSKGFILTVTLLPVFVILIYMLLALKLTLFANMLPEMIASGVRNPFAAFAKGFLLTVGRFWRMFSNSICLLLVVGVVNLFVGVFTITAGLIVTIPASSVLIAAYKMVTFYSCCGRNFYVSESVVVNLR